MSINFETVKRLRTGSKEENVTVEDDFKISQDSSNERLLIVKQDNEYREVFEERHPGKLFNHSTKY